MGNEARSGKRRGRQAEGAAEDGNLIATRSVIAAALGVVLATPATAFAEPTLDGATFTVFTRPGVTRFPDVAYDTAAAAFLVVSGQQGVTGRFVTASGVDGDAFSISDHPEAYSPRVAAASNGFIACFLVEATMSVICRRVERATPPVLGPEQVITSGTVGHLESAPSLACSSSASECLVTWVDGPELGIRARRIGLDAAPVGAVIDVAVTDAVFEAFPAIAAAEARSEYMIVYTREPDSQPMAIWQQRASIGTDSLVGAASELYTSSGLNNYPELAFDPERQRYLAISWLSESNPDVGGQLFAADGTPIGQRLAIAASAGFEGGDGIGLAFDDAADSYLAVYLGPETPGEPQQVWATPVDVDGASSPQFQVTSGAVTNGVYQPRAASDRNGRFLVVTVVDYQRIDGQFVTLETSAGGASGSAGSSGASPDGGTSDSGSGADSGSGGRGSTSAGDDSGCGCRAQPSAPRPASFMAALLALAALRVRPRRSSRESPRPTH